MLKKIWKITAHFNFFFLNSLKNFRTCDLIEIGTDVESDGVHSDVSLWRSWELRYKSLKVATLEAEKIPISTAEIWPKRKDLQRWSVFNASNLSFFFLPNKFNMISWKFQLKFQWNMNSRVGVLRITYLLPPRGPGNDLELN